MGESAFPENTYISTTVMATVRRREYILYDTHQSSTTKMENFPQGGGIIHGTPAPSSATPENKVAHLPTFY